MKLCWWCKEFCYTNSQPDYSEMTPGCSWAMACNKKIWDFNSGTTTQKEFSEMISKAETCSLFEQLTEE